MKMIARQEVREVLQRLDARAACPLSEVGDLSKGDRLSVYYRGKADALREAMRGLGLPQPRPERTGGVHDRGGRIAP